MNGIMMSGPMTGGAKDNDGFDNSGKEITTLIKQKDENPEKLDESATASESDDSSSLSSVSSPSSSSISFGDDRNDKIISKSNQISNRTKTNSSLNTRSNRSRSQSNRSNKSSSSQKSDKSNKSNKSTSSKKKSKPKIEITEQGKYYVSPKKSDRQSDHLSEYIKSDTSLFTVS